MMPIVYLNFPGMRIIALLMAEMASTPSLLSIIQSTLASISICFPEKHRLAQQLGTFPDLKSRGSAQNINFRLVIGTAPWREPPSPTTSYHSPQAHPYCWVGAATIA